VHIMHRMSEITFKFEELGVCTLDLKLFAIIFLWSWSALARIGIRRRRAVRGWMQLSRIDEDFQAWPTFFRVRLLVSIKN
jgi:hypothetical protein